MMWEVEFTDELGAWWETLEEREQESIDASVQLLEARGPQLAIHIRLALSNPDIRTCVNCVFNTMDSLIEFCMRSIRAELQYC